jgi:hypothetical protein
VSERGEPGHVGRVQQVSAGGEVVESGLGVHRLPQHDYVDHDAEAVELVFLPDLVVPPDLAALAVEDIPDAVGASLRRRGPAPKRRSRYAALAASKPELPGSNLAALADFLRGHTDGGALMRRLHGT